MNVSEFDKKLKNSCILDGANNKLKKDGWLPSSYVLDMILKEFNMLEEIPDPFKETES